METLTRYQTACALKDAAEAAARRRRVLFRGVGATSEEDLAWELENLGYAIVKLDG